VPLILGDCAIKKFSCNKQANSNSKILDLLSKESSS